MLNVNLSNLNGCKRLINGKNDYSEKLTNKNSYAAILNYVVENIYGLTKPLDFILKVILAKVERLVLFLLLGRKCFSMLLAVAQIKINFHKPLNLFKS